MIPAADCTRIQFLMIHWAIIAGIYSRPATVVYNTVNSQKNYIQINRGSNQGIKDNMAVISSDGSVVGVVVNVSPNFSQVMSLLHVQNHVSASLKKQREFGTVEWDGKDPRYLILKKIPKTVELVKGDTVLNQFSILSIFLPVIWWEPLQILTG